MKKILAWLTLLWKQLNNSYEWLRPRAVAATKVVNDIKNGIFNVADVVVAITPTTADDEFVRKAKVAAEKAIQRMAAVEGLITGHEKLEDAIEAFAKYLAGKSSEAKAKFWIELAGKIVEVLADGRVTLAEAVALAQIVYSEIKK
jgi:hypothetical protein